MKRPRYQELVLSMVLVATAAWVWAEPTRPVQAPPSLAGAAVEASGLDQALNGLTGMSSDMSMTGDDLARGIRRQIQIDDQWGELDRKPLRLAMEVQPGVNLASTVFDITYEAPETWELEAYTDVPVINFTAALGQHEWHFSPDPAKVTQVGPNHWRLKGSDLGESYTSYLDGAEGPAFVEKTDLWWSASVYVRDPRTDRYSRGAGSLALSTPERRLALR